VPDSFAVCIEEVETRWVAHVTSLPGCFASADTREQALALLPDSIREYIAWRRKMRDGTFLPGFPVELRVDEIVKEWVSPLDTDYVVNAFFASDALPLREEEIPGYKTVLIGSYSGLLAAAGGLSPEILQTPVEGEWDILGILMHCSRAAWWYLDRLDLAPRHTAEPRSWAERLALVQESLLARLPSLAGMKRIELRSDELWSPRKVVRRSIWHMRDHTSHIYQFRSRLGV